VAKFSFAECTKKSFRDKGSGASIPQIFISELGTAKQAKQ
jgi:hypothetical protein